MNSSRSSDGMKAPSIGGQVLYFKSGIEPGHQRAEIDLHQQQRRQAPARRARSRRGASLGARGASLLRGPQHRRVDRAGERQMERQPVLRDLVSVPARPDATIHQPTTPSSAPRAEDRPQPRAQPRRDPAAPQEKQKRQQEHRAGQRAPAAGASIPTNR